MLFRSLFARIGKTICFSCGNEVKKDTVSTVSNWLEKQEEEKKYYLGFPVHLHSGRTIKEELNHLKQRGFFRIFNSGKIIDLNESKTLPRSKKNLIAVIDRFKIKKGNMRSALADSLEVTFKEGEGKLSIIDAETGKVELFNNSFECCGIKYEEPEPRFFSFNNPFGACPVCQGFGRTIGYDMNLVIPNPKLSLMEGAIAPWRTVKFSRYLRDLVRVARDKKIQLNIPFKIGRAHV